MQPKPTKSARRTAKTKRIEPCCSRLLRGLIPLYTYLSFSLSLVLPGCLSYPAKLDYGQSALAGEPAKGASQILLSSQFVAELSLEELRRLDPAGDYADIWRYPLRVYRITYRSKNFSPLSALILLPVSKDIKDYPVMAWHHGTIYPFPYKHLGAYETPSFFGSRYRRPRDFFTVTSYALPAASSGYLTVLPDYMGYGVQAGTEHPFMIGSELGQEAMDAIRAAYQWAGGAGGGQQLSLRSQLYLAGISEGAYAAMWAQRLVESAADFDSIAVTGAYYAGPYHVSSLLKKIAFADGKIVPLFNWALYATWDYYLRDAQQRQQRLEAQAAELPPGQFQNQQKSWRKEDIWRKKIPTVLSILLQKPLPREKLLQPGFLQQLEDFDSDFWFLAKSLDIHYGWQPRGAIYLYHNQKDPLVPHSNSRDAARELGAAGAEISLQSFPRSDHAGGHRQYLRQSLRQFARSSGLAAPQSN